MIVIPMAGQSRRFLDAGYELPKYMLDVHGRPLFDWVMMSFGHKVATEDFLFILRDVHGSYEFVKQRFEQLGLKYGKVVVLDSNTGGQADTVQLGLLKAGVNELEPLVIFNIDTIRPGLDCSSCEGFDGWLEVSSLIGDNWSFVELQKDEPTLVARCTEKIRISDLCCTGVYQFAGCGVFMDAFRREHHMPSLHELFVAPMFNHVIADGGRVTIRSVATDRVVTAGVPAEYEELCKSGDTFFRNLEMTYGQFLRKGRNA